MTIYMPDLIMEYGQQWREKNAHFSDPLSFL